MLALAIVFLASGLLITGICMPMVYGKLPMNIWYGMRTKTSLQSEESWTHLNEIGGMLFSLLGFPMMLGGAIGLFLTDEHVTLLCTATGIVTLASIVFAVYLFLRYSARYTKGLATMRSRVN